MKLDPHVVSRRADVFGDHIELGDRYVKGIAAGIINPDVILGHTLHVQLVNAFKHADSVSRVYNIIPPVELIEGVNRVAGTLAALFLLFVTFGSRTGK